MLTSLRSKLSVEKADRLVLFFQIILNDKEKFISSIKLGLDCSDSSGYLYGFGI